MFMRQEKITVAEQIFTLEFWRDRDFYVGSLLDVAGVFSQGRTLEELRDNIQDAYDLMVLPAADQTT
jgi:predicted RNase H-like HicB family nuclease